MRKNYRYSYFYNRKSDSVFRFSVKPPYIRKNSQNAHLGQFSNKRDEKVVCKKTYLLKLEFYNTERKMKNIIRRIYTLIIMNPNFMHFCQKISSKRALGSFISVSEYLNKRFCCSFSLKFCCLFPSFLFCCSCLHGFF